MNCTVCGRINEGVDPGHDDGWLEIGKDPAVKEWACPTCQSMSMDRCPDCGDEMEDSYIKDELVDGVVASVIRLNCLSCGFTTVIYEPHNKEQDNG